MAAQQRSNDLDLKWKAVAAARDEKGFRKLVEPHMDRLLEAARYDLDYYQAQGLLQSDDVTPEEAVGEGLIRAWDDRAQKPAEMSVRGWLLGNMYRTLRNLVEVEHEYDEDKALSLDEPAPPNVDTDAVGEDFWEWYQPDSALNYEDIIPASEPIDIEAPLYTTPETFELNPDTRHVVIMHDEFQMPLSEVASVLNRNIVEIAELLQDARATLYERIGPPAVEEISHPAPPEGSDE